jgi:glucan phosphoethanolaminetransferase (alkaline phosphatase superfamily)
MIAFFDYLFYKTCLFYSRKEKTDDRLTAVFIVSFMQYFNFFTFILILLIILHHRFTYLMSVSVLCVLVILNGFRYNKLSFEMLDARWAGESEERKKKKSSYLLLYIVVSTIVFLTLIIYKGEISRREHKNSTAGMVYYGNFTAICKPDKFTS